MYNSQKGHGLKDLFRNITRPFKPILNPILKEAKAIGTELAGGLIEDLVSGKTSKASVKARGKQAKNMAVQRALQTLQGGRGNFNGNLPPTGSSLGWSGKTAKRKRSRSKSQTPGKRKRTQSRSQSSKRKRTQTGGISPPIHFPLGNYPNYNRVMKGKGFFQNIYNKFEKERIEDCKRMKRKQTGGRRAGKKRKPRKQTGGRRAGKKRKPRKQTGGRRAGKKRKPRKQTGGRRAGKKRKPQKQTGGRRKRERDAATIFDGIYDVFS